MIHKPSSPAARMNDSRSCPRGLSEPRWLRFAAACSASTRAVAACGLRCRLAAAELRQGGLGEQPSWPPRLAGHPSALQRLGGRPAVQVPGLRSRSRQRAGSRGRGRARGVSWNGVRRPGSLPPSTVGRQDLPGRPGSGEMGTGHQRGLAAGEESSAARNRRRDAP